MEQDAQRCCEISALRDVQYSAGQSALLPTLISPCFILGIASEDPQTSFPTQIILRVYNSIKIIYSAIAAKISVEDPLIRKGNEEAH